jgi:hypothetical protein
MQKEGDVVGYGIPRALGGPANETFNVFAQTVLSRDEWLNVTAEIGSFVETYPSKLVILTMDFLYENESSTRPYAFYYWIDFGDEKVSYGRILN